MSINTKTVKLLAGVAGFTMVLGLVFVGVGVVAPQSAEAQTPTTEQIIQALMSNPELLNQILASLGQQQAAPVASFNRDLTVGATGEDVRNLQVFLNQNGYTVASSGVGSPGQETTYFGALTTQAVSAFQASQEISPTAGYFGPLTRARVNSMLASQQPADPAPGTPADPAPGTGITTPGVEGSIIVDAVGLSSVDIDLGNSDVIYEVEVEALDSDIAVNRMDFKFDKRPWLYFSEFKLIRNGSTVATLNASSATEVGDDWRIRFSGLDEVVEKDEVTEYHLEAKVLASMSGTRDTETVEVFMDRDGIRATDGAGIVHFEPGAPQDETSVTFDDRFGEGDLSLTIGNNSPESLKIVVDSENRTNNVSIAEFDVKAGISNVKIEDVEVGLSVDGANLVDVVQRGRLYMGGQLVGSVVPTNSGLKFTGIDRNVSANQTRDMSVEVDFRRTSTVDYASTTPDFTVDNVTVDYENSDFKTETEVLVVDETHTLIEEGLLVTFVSSSVSADRGDNNADDIGNFTIVVDVEAIENTWFVSATSTNAEGNAGFKFTLLDSNGNDATASTTAVVVTSNAAEANNGDAWRINEGQTRRFTIQTVADVDLTGFYRLQLNGIEFGPLSTKTAEDEAKATPSTDFRTGSLYLNK